MPGPKNYPPCFLGPHCGDNDSGYICTLENEPYHPLGEHVAHSGKNHVAWVWDDLRHPMYLQPPTIPLPTGINTVMRGEKPKQDPYSYEIDEWDLLPDA